MNYVAETFYSYNDRAVSIPGLGDTKEAGKKC